MEVGGVAAVWGSQRLRGSGMGVSGMGGLWDGEGGGVGMGGSGMGGLWDGALGIGGRGGWDGGLRDGGLSPYFGLPPPISPPR